MADEAGGHISPLTPREFSGEQQDWIDRSFQHKAYARRHGAVAVQLMSEAEAVEVEGAGVGSIAEVDEAPSRKDGLFSTLPTILISYGFVNLTLCCLLCIKRDLCRKFAFLLGFLKLG